LCATLASDLPNHASPNVDDIVVQVFKRAVDLDPATHMQLQSCTGDALDFVRRACGT
jgi:hypothetical protein